MLLDALKWQEVRREACHSSDTSWALLQEFFMERLINQRHASARTVSAYRDCFRLLLSFAQRQLQRRPADLVLEDLQAPLILKFLDYLEKQRSNSIRSRNARFAAIRSFMHYACL
ncbi:MAG: phage integrase SAM-like domain-containing protein [Steroidobacteraceae bacterium]